MDEILDCFFNQVFSEMERDSLLLRYKRRQMVEYLSTVIQGCSRADGDPQTACSKAVRAALAFHATAKVKNGGVCIMGKYHNVIYVAARLVFDWKLKDSNVVCLIINSMFQCEKSFDRLMAGAVFGPKASGVISGWKSDFDTREENLKALMYFLDHACVGKAEYTVKEKKMRLVDVPMDSYGVCTPATVCAQLALPDTLFLLLQYGAQVSSKDTLSALEVVLKRLNNSDEIQPDLSQCLILIMRVLPQVSLSLADDERYLNTNIFGLRHLPETRYVSPAELKHLCRVAVRSALHANFQLPIGIWSLPIPDCIKHYVNIEVD